MNHTTLKLSTSLKLQRTSRMTRISKSLTISLLLVTSQLFFASEQPTIIRWGSLARTGEVVTAHRHSNRIVSHLVNHLGAVEIETTHRNGVRNVVRFSIAPDQIQSYLNSLMAAQNIPAVQEQNQANNQIPQPVPLRRQFAESVDALSQNSSRSASPVDNNEDSRNRNNNRPR